MRLLPVSRPSSTRPDDTIVDQELVRAIQARLDAVRPTAEQVGVVLQRMQGEDLGIRTKSNHMDLVTKADLAAEERLLASIKESFPEDEILAEESGGDPAAARAAEFAWAVDPVDGTINYAHGLPLYSVSVGLLHCGRPVGALVTQPALGTVYTAVLGQGAFCNGAAIHVSQETDLSRALVVTGFPYNRTEIMPVLLSGVESILKDARGIRRTGSAALDLCWLAHGRFGALYELNLSAWDSVGGVVLVNEAGGRVTNLLGEEYDPFGKSVVGSNRLLHEALLATLASVRKGAVERSLEM